MDDDDAVGARPLRGAWAAVADAQDDLAAVAELLRGLPPEEGAVPRARALLLDGRPAEGLALLPEVSREDVLAGRIRSWSDLVAAACWAAQGDERALGVLMSQGAGMTGGAARGHAYLVGAAAEQAGRMDVADGAWRLLFDSAPVTDHVFVRTLAAQVARRDPSDATRAAADVVDAAQGLLAWHGGEPYGIARVREVADRLVARGDRAGAALLTRALVRMRPGNERLAAVHRDHPVRRNRLVEHGARVAGVLGGGALVTLAVATEVPWIVGLVGAVGALAAPVHRLRTADGLSAVDDRALRVIDGVPMDVPEGLPRLARAPWPVLLAMLLPLSALVAFLVAVAVAIPIVPAEVELGDDPLVDGAVAGGTVVLTVVALASSLSLRRRTVARQAERRRTTDHRAWVEAVGECRCWTDDAFAAPLAQEYLARHLRASSDRVANALAGALGDAEAAQCPLTGARWLVRTDRDGQVRTLLRGPAAVAPGPAAAQGAGGYL